MLKKSHIAAVAVKRISLCFSFYISDFCIVQFDAQILLLESWKLQGNTWKFQWTESTNPYRSHFPLVTSVWEHIRTIKTRVWRGLSGLGWICLNIGCPKLSWLIIVFIFFPLLKWLLSGYTTISDRPNFHYWLVISPCSMLESWVLHGLSICFIPC